MEQVETWARGILAPLRSPVSNPDLAQRVIFRWSRVQGPVGEVAVVYHDLGIYRVFPVLDRQDSHSKYGPIERDLGDLDVPLREVKSPPEEIAEALEAGDGSELRYSLEGYRDFECSVWREILTVPKGRIVTYGELAKRIGRPNAFRAVGTALGKNPIPLLIPCHRVIRGDGSVGEYGLGSDYKVQLLRHEGVVVAENGYVVR